MRDDKIINKENIKRLATGLFAFSIVLAAIPDAFGESLFRAQANYSASGGYIPGSIFAQPIPAQVGDIVTIVINETTQQRIQGEIKIERENNINENGTSIFNRFIHQLGVPHRISLPTFTGLNNNNELESSAETLRTTRLTDQVTCQVVQVLPNGNLVVQGHKVVSYNKERQDLYISGIVNPYYLNQQNQINSTLVANFQMLTGGRGVISRQQNDSWTNKIYQFFN